MHRPELTPGLGAGVLRKNLKGVPFSPTSRGCNGVTKNLHNAIDPCKKAQKLINLHFIRYNWWKLVGFEFQKVNLPRTISGLMSFWPGANIFTPIESYGRARANLETNSLMLKVILVINYSGGGTVCTALCTIHSILVSSSSSEKCGLQCVETFSRAKRGTVWRVFIAGAVSTSQCLSIRRRCIIQSRRSSNFVSHTSGLVTTRGRQVSSNS